MPSLGLGLDNRPVIRRLLAHKYSLILGAVLLAHVGLVGLAGRQAAPLSPLIVLCLYFLGFLLMRDRSGLARIIQYLGVAALLLSVVALLAGGIVCLAGALAGHAVFLLMLSVFILGRLFREKRVTLDIVMAGVIVYLFMAGFWAQVYTFLVLLRPGAVSMAGGGLGIHPYITLYYFSVTTLTTAGFGDVFPVSDLARILAAYESLVGQVYLVVFIALLMGRHFASK